MELQDAIEIYYAANESSAPEALQGLIGEWLPAFPTLAHFWQQRHSALLRYIVVERAIVSADRATILTGLTTIAQGYLGQGEAPKAFSSFSRPPLLHASTVAQRAEVRSLWCGFLGGYYSGDAEHTTLLEEITMLDAKAASLTTLLEKHRASPRCRGFDAG